MHRFYADILGRIAETPRWFDEHGVPRYCEFHPSQLNVYADEAALMEIACQLCKREFIVAVDRANALAGMIGLSERKYSTVAELIRNHELRYGDPPNIECCWPGPTMNSIPHRVLEYWHRQSPAQWVRDQALEIELRPSWVR